MRNRFRLLLIGLAALAFAGSFLSGSSAQKRIKPFSHNTPAHKSGEYKDCSSCHTLPSKNWQSPIKYGRKGDDAFPDVVDFPYKNHATCNNCHAGNQVPPDLRTNSNNFAFCGSCHTSLKGGETGMRRFPNTAHQRQFEVYFPHDVHQDIIASNYQKKDVAVAHFVLASFTPNLIADDKGPQFNNCIICHSTLTALKGNPKFDMRKLPAPLTPLPAAEPDVFDPKAEKFDPNSPIAPEFFKDMPSSHASCFSCHYSGVKPVATDCAGCHKLADTPYSETKTIHRYSLRFEHESTNHSNKDCTTCHLRITQNSDTRLMKDADVPISTCVSCHGAKANGVARTEKAYLGSALTNEMAARKESECAKTKIFQCSYCHTAASGRFPVPMRHIHAAPTPAPCKEK